MNENKIQKITVRTSGWHMRIAWKARGRFMKKVYVFFSRGGDSPEHILVTRVENLNDDWHEWQFTEPQAVLKPEKDYEGVNEPIEESRFGATYNFVHQLRDPAIFEADGHLYLLYSTAGEWAIAIAELHFEEE